MLNKINKTTQGGTTTTTTTTSDGDGGGSGAGDTASKGSGAKAGTTGSWTPGGTYTAPAKQRDYSKHSAYGLRDGGRIGYAFAGPVGVEQETDFIEGPQGGEEFQETVVEGQEQPSREQLEALAMHIFQLPLEELDDQQLLVVYQAAMQGEPMEEAVQEEGVQFADQGQPMEEDIAEEDIQYAAQGGLASIL